MTENVIMPKLGMAMKEGKVVKWHCKEGEHIKEGDVIAEIETEKVTYEIETPISGVLVRILVTEGQVAAVGQAIGILVAEGEAYVESAIPAPPLGAYTKEELVATAEKQTEILSPTSDHCRIRITPVARRIAREKGVDISKLKGGGPDGRITRDDVLAALEAPQVKESSRVSGIGFGTTISLTRMREIIGERLTASSRDVPHVYFSFEIDGTGMLQFRDIFTVVIKKETGVRLSFNDILLKAVAAVIVKYPLFNSTLEGKTIKIHQEVNIGLAVAVEDGLIVPVLRRVNEKMLAEIAIARQEILDKANRKKLTLDDLSGGTFTISNLGRFNIDFFTSIINPPETAILSVAKMKERPVVVKGEIKIRPTFNIGLSVDHRVVDGAMAAEFLEELQTILENPYLMCRA